MIKSEIARRGARPISAFTIIELLAVIAVIAILVALLIPALVGAQGKAYQATCISNLKQIHSAVSLWSGDNDGCLPACTNGLFQQQRADYSAADSQSKNYLVHYITTYMGGAAPTDQGSTNIAMFCPGFQKMGVKSSNIGGKYSYGVYAQNYDTATNLNFMPFGYPIASPQTYPVQFPRQWSSILKPSSTYMMGDLDQIAIFPATTWSPDTPAKPVHGVTRNFVFFDGHVVKHPVGTVGTLY